MTLIKELSRTLVDLWSLVVGLMVTGKFFFKPQVTVHYPRKVVVPNLTDTFRGPIELVPDPGTPLKTKCIACLMCVSACPSHCITVVKAKAPKPTPEEEQAMAEAKARGEKVKKPADPKVPAEWTYDFSLCSLCATCVEACPVDAIRFSHELYVVGTDRKSFIYDLLARVKDQAGKNGAEA